MLSKDVWRLVSCNMISWLTMAVAICFLDFQNNTRNDIWWQWNSIMNDRMRMRIAKRYEDTTQKKIHSPQCEVWKALLKCQDSPDEVSRSTDSNVVLRRLYSDYKDQAQIRENLPAVLKRAMAISKVLRLAISLCCLVELWFLSMSATASYYVSARDTFCCESLPLCLLPWLVWAPLHQNQLLRNHHHYHHQAMSLVSDFHMVRFILRHPLHYVVMKLLVIVSRKVVFMMRLQHTVCLLQLLAAPVLCIADTEDHNKGNIMIGLLRQWQNWSAHMITMRRKSMPGAWGSYGNLKIPSSYRNLEIPSRVVILHCHRRLKHKVWVLKICTCNYTISVLLQHKPCSYSHATTVHLQDGKPFKGGDYQEFRLSFTIIKSMPKLSVLNRCWEHLKYDSHTNPPLTSKLHHLSSQ